MTARILVTMIVLFILLGVLLGCSATTPTTPTTSTIAAPSPTRAEIIQWKGQTYTPVSPAYGPFSRDKYPYLGGASGPFHWRDWLEEATNGRLKLEILPVGSVVPAADQLKAVEEGVLDFAIHYAGYSTAIVPEGNIMVGLPCSARSPIEIFDWGVRWGLYDEFHKVFAERGIYSISYPVDSPYGIGSRSPIRDRASIRGKKIRATGVYGEWISMLGATPVNIAYADTYMALAMGTVDGWCSGIASMEEAKFKEVSKYWVTSPSPGPLSCVLLINQKKFDQLPEDIKRLIDRESIRILFATSTVSMESEYIRGNPDIESVSWPAADVAAVTAETVDKVWSKIASLNPRCAKLVEMTKDWMRAYGRIK